MVLTEEEQRDVDLTIQTDYGVGLNVEMGQPFDWKR